jgi:pimeloyl-ACP methyl ester carboxylesterase
MRPRTQMLAGLPVRERRLQLAGAPTLILEAGDGPPLVLLHGGIECGGPVWAPVIERLAASRRVIVPDLPGLGESEPVDDAFGTFDAWFRELVGRTCAEPPVLVAHSLGGSLAAAMATRHGAILRRLVLYGAPAVGPYRLPLGLRVVAIRFALRPTRRNGERFERWAFFDYDGYRAREPGWLEAFGEETGARARVPHTKRAMRRLIRRGTKRIPDPELRSIPVGVELIWGRHDRFVPLGLAQGASKRLGWPLHVIDEAGHVPHIERPGAFLEALHDTLAAPRSDAAAIA